MAINKVMRRSGEVLLDLSTDSVTPETLMSGTTSHDASGETIQGTFTIDSELTTQDNLISQIQTALQNKAAGSEPVLQSKQVTPTTSQQIVKPDNGYDGLSQVTIDGIFTAEQATPSITVSTSGLITASSTQTAGFVNYGTKSATKQLTTQAAQTITPGTSNKTIASGRYLTGTQTIKGDSNLVARNIKSGVSIFGVAGSYEGSGGGSGGSVESCELSYNAPAGQVPSPSMPVITFTNPEMVVETYEFDSGDNYIWALAKNTIVIVQYTEQAFPVYGLGELIFSGIGHQAIKVTGDCTLGRVGGTNPA